MKKGYTLSEVLVVLLVLGIIAAFIIPAVMRTAPDRAALLYKKSFYSMQEAASKMINNPDLYPIGVTSGVTTTKGLFTDYDTTTFCNNLANTFNILKQGTDTASCNNGGAGGAPNFITTNGVKWFNVGGGPFTGDGKDAYKDINVECAGTEYKIRIYADGRVGTDGAETWNKENSILKSPFKFRDL